MYITKTHKKNLMRKYRYVYLFFKHNFKNKSIKNFIKTYSNLEKYVQSHNDEYFQKQLNDYNNLLNNIDGKSLDLQQKSAVLNDDKNTLIIARSR